ncbi:sensor histidine kinase [Aquimarina sp. 2201CG5-10]|uniref:sensor histidine kinase n=1 Tax=Aquimarina callyspongiae TaxID=3098150 RepID=UPI002AB51F13|nr:histidine kinase [Aquimarina sp. 2201CG5-10]MDY8136058.1 histidine kinase [Aquimarina sp. 2201CG5-10]
MNISKIMLVAGHILFWLFSYWFIAFGSDLNWNGFSTYNNSLAYAYTYGLIFNAVLFYTQVFWLFSKIYKRKKKVLFYVLTITLIVSITVIETYGDYILYDVYDIRNESLSGSFISNFLVHIIYTIAGFYYALKFDYRKSEKIKQQLLEETYKTELKYLKAQLNPHFLFNGINSIYHLIGKNDDLAKQTLLQFSGLLRYQLYESNTHILLEKELDYVLKFIKIEETRRGSDIQLDYDVKSENPTLKITPLLLIPFIENAFKHCSNNIDGSTNIIKIKIEEVGGTLYLNVVNSYDESTYKKKVGGIGLNNVQKRLLLLYPDQHQLSIKKDETNHIVNLSINL